MNPTQ
jgi:Ras-related GTP-binding protein A/B